MYGVLFTVKWTLSCCTAFTQPHKLLHSQTFDVILFINLHDKCAFSTYIMYFRFMTLLYIQSFTKLDVNH